MCGRIGALSVSCTRCRGRSRMNAERRSATTTSDEPPIFADKIHSSPIPLCVVTTAKLDQIGEQQAQKKAQDARLPRLRRSAAGRRRRPTSARSLTPGNWSHEPDQLAALEIVGGTGEDQAARQRTVMQVRRDLASFHYRSSAVRALALDLRRRSGRRRRAARATAQQRRWTAATRRQRARAVAPRLRRRSPASGPADVATEPDHPADAEHRRRTTGQK